MSNERNLEFLGRQPIVDHGRTVVVYEALIRCGLGGEADVTDKLLITVRGVTLAGG